jgi:hypothetical protein
MARLKFEYNYNLKRLLDRAEQITLSNWLELAFQEVTGLLNSSCFHIDLRSM